MAVTIRDIAKLANTSVTSVSAALHGSSGTSIRISAETRERILRIAEQEGYVSPQMVRRTQSESRMRLAVVAPERFYDTCMETAVAPIVAGVLRECGARHCDVVIYTSVRDFGRGNSIKGSDLPAGLIVLSFPGEEDGAAEAKRLGIPFVTVGPERPVDEWRLGVDSVQVGELAARHLVDLGHRRFAFLQGWPSFLNVAAVLEGFRGFLSRKGLPTDRIQVLPAGRGRNRGYTSTLKMLSQTDGPRPTAVLTFDELSARGAIQAARDGGLSVPHDLSVIACGDGLIGGESRLPVTTVRLPLVELGRRAVKMVASQIENPHQPPSASSVDCSLSICQTTSPPHPWSEESIRSITSLR